MSSMNLHRICRIGFSYCVFGLLCCGGKIGVEEKIIGNDHGHKNAREWKGSAGQQDERENENAGFLEQSGIGQDETRYVVECLQMVTG